MNKNKILLKRIESFCCDIFKSQDIEIEKLKGGINNQVFKCFKEKRCVVVKTYPTSAMGEKFTAEKEFLKLAGSVAREWVPKLIHADSQYKFLVMEYVYGSRYTKPPIVEDVKAAISFYLKINADESIARKLLKVQARDGFLSVSEHIKLIEDRISQFNTGHLPYKYSLELKNILELTKSKWSYIRDKNLNLLNEKPDLDAIEKKYLKVSPGDFGFHNVIKTSKGLRFIDFEYAGWDDPTKTIVDFFLQPKFPIKKKLVSEVINLIQKIEHQSPYPYAQ